MKSITLHKMDEELSRALERRAREEGTSLNQMAKKLLRSSLDLEEKPRLKRKKEYLDQFGTWTAEEVRRFEERMSEFGEIDHREW